MSANLDVLSVRYGGIKHRDKESVIHVTSEPVSVFIINAELEVFHFRESCLHVADNTCLWLAVSEWHVMLQV